MEANAFYQQASELLRSGRSDDAIAALEDWLAEHADDEIGLSLYGSALLRSDRVADALNAFKRATAAHPASAAAWGDLGFALMQTGDATAATGALEQATSHNEQFYQGWVFLSRLKFESGDHEASVAAFRNADNCDPLLGRFADVQRCMQNERYAEAEKMCRQLLQQQPGYPRAAYTLAQLASQVGAFEEASRILAQALRYYPADANLYSALVTSYEEGGEYAAALEAARQLVTLTQTNSVSWLVLGRIHGHCGNYDECLETYDRALELSNNDAEIGNTELLRGHILKILGRYDDGIAAYRRSAELIAGNGAAWWGLADMKTFRFGEEDVAAMTAVANDESLKPDQRAQAAFALGKAAEDNQEFSDAFRWYAEGNALRSGVSFDPETQRKGINSIIDACSEEVLAVQAKPLPEGPTPIFILGLPRSGSTLLEQILASHSRIEGTMELANLPNLVRHITIEGGKQKLDYPASMSAFSPAELSAFGQRYIDETAMYRTGADFFIDKLPTNFDKIGLIHKILPQAIIIDARRDPMDCGFSCFKQHFAGGHLFSYDLEHIAAYYRSYEHIMQHWDAVLPGKVLLAQYEDTIADTEGAVRRLLAHCGVEFEESCLNFFENKRPVRTASSEQVRQPIYKKGVGYWRNFEDELEPLARALQGDL